ncbi:MAG: arylsulfotransferase family protein [Paracoccaceae bacterium]
MELGRMQRILLAKIEVWLVLALAILGIVGALVFAAMVLDAARVTGHPRFVQRAALAVAEVPLTAQQLLRGGSQDMHGFRAEKITGTGWSFAEGAAGTGLLGYLLVSRFDGDRRRPVVDLMSLADGKTRLTWAPDIDAILADAPRTSLVATLSNWTNARFRIIHPDVTGDGGLLVKDMYSPLVRIDACGVPEWRLDAQMFHHSTESDGNGNWWIGGVIEPATIPHVPPGFFDDAATLVSPEGKVLTTIPLSELFIRKGLRSLIHPIGRFDKDPLHNNDIEPVLADGPYWRKGDLFLSFRANSTIFLYRPSTDEIVWSKRGPWEGQHDIDILDDHRIAIYDNRAYHPGDFGRVDGASDVVVYDFATGQVSHPWKAAMEREGVQSLFEGLFTVLPGGALVVENHATGLILVLGPDGRTLARYVNRGADGEIYQLGWGRWIDPARGEAAIAAAEGVRKEKGCPAAG